MSIFDVLTMVGGLALFLYGMDLMGDGLSKASGGRMEKILEKMTSTPIKGVLLGAAVTAVIQSSSATTVMVVGFVNSGIMKLSQAVGIIMGANIGTTVTSWILSLSGIQGDNLLIKLLKPTSFAPVFAVIGIILLMFCKKENKKTVGTIMVGFSILMTGMATMSDAVAPLADVPEFTSILLMFKNPLLGMLAGLILTAVIQSSSASVGILQALCVTGSVSFGAALPIIMGQNIGTCVTAMISSIGATKNAKRTAFVHLYFNVIGTAIFMAGFYALNAFLHFNFIDDTANAAGIAVIHSIFNIVATLILLPFHKILEKLACLTVRDNGEVAQTVKDVKALQMLDIRFLDKPALAMEQCRAVTGEMAELARKGLFKSMKLLSDYSDAEAERVMELENAVDHYEDELGSYMVKLSSKDLSERDSASLSMLLRCINDIERISDHSVNIMEKAQDIHNKKLIYSDKAKTEMGVFSAAVEHIVNLALEALSNDDINKANTVEPLEEVIDELNEEMKRRHVRRLRKGECSMDMGFVLSDLTLNYERVADHCSNLALSVIECHQNMFEGHEYMDVLKSAGDELFKAEFKRDKEKYALPEA